MAAIMGTKVGSHTATQLYGVYSTEWSSNT
jgi:hypothetical protein